MGKPLYYYARKGEKIHLDKRIVNIYSIKLLSLKKDVLDLKIKCSSGTYIRSIAREIGSILGYGGIVTQLLRTKIGNFYVEDSVEAEKIIELISDEWSLRSKSYLLPIEKILENKPDLYINKEYKKHVVNGHPICGYMIDEKRTMDYILEKGNIIKIKDLNENILAIHEIISEEMLSDIIKKEIRFTKSIVIF
jgi:tRNA pseudouridine55 synthase